MPTTLPRRTWLLLAVTITIQLVILRSTRALKQDELQDRADLTRNGDPFQASSAIYPRHLLTILQTALLAVPYERWYADTPAPLKPLVGLGFIIVLVFLFSFIGISASDFFCPNLSTIAAYLGLNESTAGVTFLAFGNGSPDVFSTFSALKGGTFGLAIGELIGAASFSESRSDCEDSQSSRIDRGRHHRSHPPLPCTTSHLHPRHSLLHHRSGRTHSRSSRWSPYCRRVRRHGRPVHLLRRRRRRWQLVESSSTGQGGVQSAKSGTGASPFFARAILSRANRPVTRLGVASAPQYLDFAALTHCLASASARPRSVPHHLFSPVSADGSRITFSRYAPGKLFPSRRYRVSRCC